MHPHVNTVHHEDEVKSLCDLTTVTTEGKAQHLEPSTATA